MVNPSSARMAHLALLHWPNASVSGAREWVPSAFIRTKAGLSANCNRIQTEIASKKIDTRNGMRQPEIHCVEVAAPWKSAGLIVDWVNRMISSERNKPSVAVVWIQLV